MGQIRLLANTLTAVTLALGLTGVSLAADLSVPQPAPAPAQPVPVARAPAPPPPPRGYLPPAYDAPTVRWRNGYHGHGWKRYNGWWFPPEGFQYGAPYSGPNPPSSAPPYAPTAWASTAGTHAPTAPEPTYAPPPPAPEPRQLAGDVRTFHVNWCLEKYRSYLVADNTFQPYAGPRQACTSPYWP